MPGLTGEAWRRLQSEVIADGICTHCGTCVGLSQGTLTMAQTEEGPIPRATNTNVNLPPLAYDACPGKGIDYAAACATLFGSLPENWLLGNYEALYVGHATDRDVRRRAASGGVLTQTLLYLLQEKMVDGAVVLEHGQPEPWLARPIIATTAEELLAAAQSVYVPVPVNVILDQMTAFDGRLAFVGLPDQVAALRCLQQAGHRGAGKVDFVLGPYMGTAVYLEAVRSYLRANGVQDLRQIKRLRYREGEWPGSLQIELRSGRILHARKFYYNYLIPFYITQSSLQSVDFTNELTDISAGDAWHPRYEARGAGYSVVIARSHRGDALLQQMQAEGALVLEQADAQEVISMHGHMIDFKKRGAFIRNDWRKARGKAVPSYGYGPSQIPASRKVVELIIVMLFAIGRTALARRAAELIPLAVMGPLFDGLRKIWKRLSKPVKRNGLGEIGFQTVPVGWRRNSDGIGAR